MPPKRLVIVKREPSITPQQKAAMERMARYIMYSSDEARMATRRLMQARVIRKTKPAVKPAVKPMSERVNRISAALLALRQAEEHGLAYATEFQKRKLRELGVKKI